MRKLLICTISAVLLVFFITSCGYRHKNEHRKPLIITTIHPYELIVKELVDSLITVETFLPSDASVQTWTPGHQDAKRLEKADLVIANSLGLENNQIKALNRIGKKLIIASSYVDKNKLIRREDKIKHDAEYYREKFNPNIWESPEILTNVIIGLTYELARHYPRHKADFEKKSRLMIMEINHVDGLIRTERENYSNPTIYTYDDAFAYYFGQYKINSIVSEHMSPDKKIDSRQLNILTDQIRAKSIKAIFIEPQMHSETTEINANKLNLKVLKYDVWGTSFKAHNIAEFLYFNWIYLKKGL